MCFGFGSKNDGFKFDRIKLLGNWEEKTLDVIIDNELKFDPHIRSMCKETGQKLRLLKTIFLLLDPEKKKLVFNALVKSYYSYHPLVWIVIHERSQGTEYNDTNNTLQEFLQRNRSVSILHKNIQL